MSEQKETGSLSFISSAFKFSIATWVNALLYAVAVFAINLFVDKAIQGPYELMINAAVTLMSVVTLGLDHSYIRFYNEPPGGAKDFRQVAAAGLAISLLSLFVISAVILLAIPQLIGKAFFEGGRDAFLLISTCFFTLFMVVIRFFNITYRMRGNVLMFSLVSISLQFFTRAFYIFGAVIKPDFYFVSIFGLAGFGIFTLFFFLAQRKAMLPKRYEVRGSAYAPLLKYGLGLMPSSVLLWGNQLVNKLFIGANLGDSALGVFAFAALVSQALGIVQGGFATFWSAYMFKNYKSEEERIKKTHDYLMFAMMCMMCLLILSSPLIFLLLSNYSQSRPIFGMMLFAPLLMVIAETTVYGIEIAKKTVFNTIASLLGLLVNIALSALLIPAYGLTGAAVSLAVSTAAMFLFRTIVAQRLYRTIRSYQKTAVSLAVMAALSTLSWLLDGRHLLLLGISVVALLFYMAVYRREFLRLTRLTREVLDAVFLKKRTKKPAL